jgi:hypothetical protein
MARTFGFEGESAARVGNAAVKIAASTQITMPNATAAWRRMRAALTKTPQFR